MATKETTRGAVTEIFILPVTDPELAVTVTEPRPLPVNTPAEEITAEPVPEEAHATAVVRSFVVPSLYVPVAVSWIVRPAATEGADEAILRDFRTGELPLFPPEFEPLFELPPQPVHEKSTANTSGIINFRILAPYFTLRPSKRYVCRLL